MRAFVSAALFASLVACGGQGVQHAIVGPRSFSAPPGARASASLSEVLVAPPSSDIEQTVNGPGFVVTPKGAHFELVAATPLGDQTFVFRHFSARAHGIDSPQFHARFDTTSLEGGAPGLAQFVKSELLEVKSYPMATFDGVVLRGSDGECTVEGTLTLHGVSRTLRFDGMLFEEGDGMRLVSTFYVPRKAFGIAARGAMDAFIPDEVRVVLDVRARRDHVTVEEVP